MPKETILTMDTRQAANKAFKGMLFEKAVDLYSQCLESTEYASS
jgi:hypothetical protein